MVIDDGGHLMKLQQPSFEVLWDHVMPGGVYFIEDLDVVPAGCSCDDALDTVTVVG